MIEGEDAVAVERPSRARRSSTRPATRYAAAAFENVPWMSSSERSVDDGFPGSRSAFGQRVLRHPEPPFLQPSLVPGGLFERRDELGQHQADGLVCAAFGHLDENHLDDVGRDAARSRRHVRGPDGDDEPHLRRAAARRGSSTAPAGETSARRTDGESKERRLRRARGRRRSRAPRRGRRVLPIGCASPAWAARRIRRRPPTPRSETAGGKSERGTPAADLDPRDTTLPLDGPIGRIEMDGRHIRSAKERVWMSETLCYIHRANT